MLLNEINREDISGVEPPQRSRLLYKLIFAVRLLSIAAPFAILLYFNASWLVFAIGLLVSVVLHEVGHFVTAKWTGMKPTQMYVGFGPKIFSFTRGEVAYGVRAIPLGAFVSIVGMYKNEEVAPEDEHRAFRNKSLPRRLLVLSAGSIMHLIIAFILLFGFNVIEGQRTLGVGARVVEVVSESVADNAGVLEGDVIVWFDGAVAAGVSDFVSKIRSIEPGQGPIEIMVDRGGELEMLEIEFPDSLEKSVLGVRLEPRVEANPMNPIEATGESLEIMGDMVVVSMEGLVKVFNPFTVWEHLSGQREDLETRPMTVVGATGVSDDIVRTSGWAGMVLFLAGVNMVIGIVNYLPLPPLDGGHVTVALYEGVRARLQRKKRYFVNPKNLSRITIFGISILATLFLAGLYLDITRPV